LYLDKHLTESERFLWHQITSNKLPGFICIFIFVK
jgi:hypothetical protein